MSVTRSIDLEAQKIDPRKLEIHPLAEKLPPMTKEDFDHLKRSVQEQGLLVSIVLYAHEGTIKVLEGRNRIKACKELPLHKFKPDDFVEYCGLDPFEFVLSSNLDRRQLNESQRAMLAADIVNADFGTNQYYRKGIITAAVAAKMFKVSEASVKTAKEVKVKATPEDVERIRKGLVRVSAIKKKLDAEKPSPAATQTPASASAPLEPAKDPKDALVKVKGKQGRFPLRQVQVDQMKESWRELDELQQRAFVMAFKGEIAAHLEYINTQAAMVGKAA